MKRIVRIKRTKEKLVAVDHVSFKIRKGEVFGLLGPNGAGKTTLIKTLCTLLWPNEGTARINGFDIRKDPKKTRASLGTVLDIHMGWYGRLSCRQNLLFYGQLSGLRGDYLRRRLNEVIEFVGLEEKADEWQQKLSSGMKRKLDLARALLPDPPVLLLDEPTLALDPGSARDLRNMVKNQLCQEMGRTVLWTTHNMDEANKICDRVSILHRGKLLAVGEPDTIRETARTSNMVVAEVDRNDAGLVESLERMPDVRSVKLDRSRKSPELYTLRVELVEKDVVTKVSSEIMRHNVGLHSLFLEEISLEEALLQMTSDVPEEESK